MHHLQSSARSDQDTLEMCPSRSTKTSHFRTNTVAVEDAERKSVSQRERTSHTHAHRVSDSGFLVFSEHECERVSDPETLAILGSHSRHKHSHYTLITASLMLHSPP